MNHRLTAHEERQKELKAEKAKLERQIEQFLGRIADAEIPSVVAAYENRIRQLEADKLQVAEQIANCGCPIGNFDETVRTAFEYWVSENIENKRAVLKLTFINRPA